MNSEIEKEIETFLFFSFSKWNCKRHEVNPLNKDPRALKKSKSFQSKKHFLQLLVKNINV